jgi:alkaline phosphatase D
MAAEAAPEVARRAGDEHRPRVQSLYSDTVNRRRAIVSRRAFLAGGLALVPCASFVRSIRAVQRTPQFASDPFTLGVASGDPSPDGFVLWTRLAPVPLSGDGGMDPEPVEVAWEVAADSAMRDIVKKGTDVAEPEWAHSVHVEVDGLEPGRWYWYRFRCGSFETAVGRARTLPRPGADVRRLTLAFASCQAYEVGYFTALRHLADENPDLIFHLGDYIYENGGPARNTIRPHSNPEPYTLAAYRERYAQYKTDPDLQAAHLVAPWIVTWDDHEVDNNYAGVHSQRNDPIDEFTRRRAAAYRAYYEHQPLRARSKPRNLETGEMRLYRAFEYGSLVAFFVLDTRQYRTDQPCGDGTKELCDAVFDPGATMMGPVQEAWLYDGLDRSRARWNVLPQQVMMAALDEAPGDAKRYSMDQWTGYGAERMRLLTFLHDRRPSNPVVLTGDIHSNWVNDLLLDFTDSRSPVVATELVGSSITSGGDGSDFNQTMDGLKRENPFVKFCNGQRGYVTCEITPAAMRAHYRVVDYIRRPGSPIHTRASFVIEDGRPGATPL